MEELAPMSVGERITGDTSWLLLAPEAWPVENSPVFLVMVESRGVGGERWVTFPPPPTTLFFLKYPHLPNSVHSCLDVHMDGLRPERQGGYPGQPVGPLQRQCVAATSVPLCLSSPCSEPLCLCAQCHSALTQHTAGKTQ